MFVHSVCVATLSISEHGPGRFGLQHSSTDFYHTIHTMPQHTIFRLAVKYPVMLRLGIIVRAYLYRVVTVHKQKVERSPGT